MAKNQSQSVAQFEQAVFAAIYQSPKQRWWRAQAVVILSLKHIVRGLITIWPLYAVLLALFFLQVNDAWWYTVTLLPGASIWFLIYIKGIRRDYQLLVRNQILKPGFIQQLLFPEMSEEE